MKSQYTLYVIKPTDCAFGVILLVSIILFMSYYSAGPLTVHISGPHSAPSSTIFSSQHAVLVATGIGVTPFASILQSIVARCRQVSLVFVIYS